MTEDAKDLLQNLVHDQNNNTKLGLAIIAQHKMARMADLLSDCDIVRHRLSANLRDPEKTPKDNKTLLKILKLLSEIQAQELDFLRLSTSSAAEKQGFSGDPRNQLNIFLNANEGPVGTPTLPDDLTTESRRKIQKLFDGLTAMLSGEVPEPPKRAPRYIEANPIVPPGAHDDRGQPEQEGPGNTRPEDR